MQYRRSKVQGLIVLALVLATVISACGSPAPAAVAPAVPAPQLAEAASLELPPNIDAPTVDQIRERDDVVILDVREDWEFASGHVPGADWIPLGQLSSRLDELPRDKTIVAVCRSGNRSGQATDLLRQQGFEAHNMEGGMLSWEQLGLDVER